MSERAVTGHANHGSPTGTEPLRVLHLLEATLGGTRRYLDNIIAATADAGYAQGLVFSERRADSGLESTLDVARAAGWTLFEVDMRRSLHPVRDAMATLRVRRLIREFGAHLVHCHSSKAGGVGRLASRSLRAPPAMVYSPHALAVHLSPVYLHLERWLAGLGGAFVAVSESERSQIMTTGVAPAERVTVVPPVIDAYHFAPRSREAARRRLSLGPGPLLVDIGRLTRQKDPLAFARLVAAVSEEVPEVRGVWVGDGEMRGALESEIHRLGLRGRVEIAGWQRDVRPFMAAADVVVSTARYESFGYVVPEALAMERPVVATDVTGTSDILADWAELALFDRDDLALGARLVTRLLEEPDVAREYAVEGRAHVERTYSPARMRARLEAAYRLALNGQARTPRDGEGRGASR